MRIICLRHASLPLIALMTVLLSCFPPFANAEWVHDGQAQEGKVTASFRAGFSIPTQEMIVNTDGGFGPAVNLHLQYGLNRYFAAGFMVEWEHLGYEQDRPNVNIGTRNTVSLLPTLEYRPGRFGSVIPYVSTGIGVNVNTFNEEPGIPKTSLANTFAWRIAGGIDIPLTDQLMLNAELAWKRNRGGLEVGNVDAGSFDASTANLLFGAKYTF
ncbi:hypothetical protein YTPLAS18_02700 [Nitrospira sp.]|nr:hypothetical protein YTPLAS18_02700 [Nitrospira sp.]